MLAKEVKELKSKKGDVKMCKLMEDLIEKEKMDVAKKALTTGISIDKTVEILSLPVETIESLAREMHGNAVKV